jgi:hypothetical protein
MARQTRKREQLGSEFGAAEPCHAIIFWIIFLFIAATKTCPISSAIFKSRDIASRASSSIAVEGSGRSVTFSWPLCRIVIAKLAKDVARAAGFPLTSAVWREPLDKTIRRKLMPSLEHVTWRDPTVTPSRLAISSRLIPCATKPLICSITCGVNLTRLPLAEGLAFVIVMTAPLVAQRVQRIFRFS